MAKTICITGVYGLLGQNLVRALQKRGGYTIVGIDVIQQPVNNLGISEYHTADITQEATIGALLRKINPDVLVNTAAMTNVDLCETERDAAKALNGDSALYMAEAVSPSCKFVQISTDYVFDGVSGPYADNDAVNPISWYGATKLFAERAVLHGNSRGLVVRTMVLVGKLKGGKTDFIHFVKTSLEKGKPIKIVTDQVGNVTLASNLAANIVEAIEQDVCGVLSLSGSEIISRFDFAIKIAKRYSLDKSLVLPITTAELKQPAKRPLCSGFLLDGAQKLTGMRLLSIDQMMMEYNNE